MKVIVFDTETTGLPQDYNALITDSAKWPHIVQLSYIVYDTDTKEILDFTDRIVYLDPAVVTISPESMAVHKITAERSQEEGKPIGEVLAEFMEALKDVDLVVGHNIGFDKRMIGVECNRNGIHADPFVNANQIALPDYCTMRETTARCQLPTLNKKTGQTYWKWPKLSELHTHLFGSPPKGTHNAIADVMICLRCFIFLRDAYDIASTQSTVLVPFQCLYANYCL